MYSNKKLGDKNWNKEVKLALSANNIKVYIEIARESLRIQYCKHSNISVR